MFRYTMIINAIREYKLHMTIPSHDCLAKIQVTCQIILQDTSKRRMHYTGCSFSGKSKISPTNSATFVSFWAYSLIKSNSNN